MLQEAEIEDDDGADERFQNQQELDLRNEIGLARFINQLGDLEHGAVNRGVLQLVIDH